MTGIKLSAAVALILSVERPLQAGLLLNSDVRNASLSGSARANWTGPITDSYSFSANSNTPFADFHPSFSEDAGGPGATAYGTSSVRQDSAVGAESAIYQSQLFVNVARGFGSPMSQSLASADSSFHLSFTVPSELLYSLAFDLNFSGFGSYPSSIPMTWNYTFSSTNHGVIGTRSMTRGENFAGPHGVDPGDAHFTYAGVLDPTDVYTIDFSQHLEAEAISDNTNARMTSTMTLAVIPEADSGIFWGIGLCGFFAATRRRTRPGCAV